MRRSISHPVLLYIWPLSVVYSQFGLQLRLFSPITNSPTLWLASDIASLALAR
jgi:hypothetical protein